jgi:Peptidase family M48
VLAATLCACAAKQETAAMRVRERAAEGRRRGSTPIAVERAEFVASSLAAIRAAAPASPGGRALRDAVITDSGIAQAVATYGIPGAVEYHSTRNGRTYWFQMYYRLPPRTLVFERKPSDIEPLSLGAPYHGRMIADLKDVPRSARVLGFGEQNLPPPWPVTIAANLYRPFNVPMRPAGPPAPVNGADYRATARALAERIAAVPSGRDFRRAHDAFVRLSGVARTPGLDWQLVVFDSSEPIAFGVPDGTAFLSNGLVAQLDDARLAAALAHVMAHIRYQHAREARQRYDLWAAQQTISGAVTTLAGIVAFPVYPFYGGAEPQSPPAPGSSALASEHYLEILLSPWGGYTRGQEGEANALAADYLRDARLPSDTIFYAMLALGPRPFVSEPESLRFADMHRLDWALPDLGRMLDAGIIASP